MSSILLRRKRLHNPHNDTSFESQWEKEQAKLEARRANAAARNAAILGRLQKDPNQKKREKEQQVMDMREYMKRVKEEAARQKALEKKEAEEIAARENKLMQQDEKKNQARREWSAEMMQKNRELCEYRFEKRQEDYANEKKEDAKLNIGNNHFMNRFGSSVQ